MACSPQVLKGIPLFSLLDDEETAVLAAQVELKTFRPANGYIRPETPTARPTS